jgi:hypothetical protein
LGLEAWGLKNMDIILLGITVVSLGVALVMSVTAWRLTRDEKKRSAARVAALSLAAGLDKPKGLSPQVIEDKPAPQVIVTERPAVKAPWAAPKIIPAPVATSVAPAELPLNQPRVEAARVAEPSISHASGFLGAAELQHDSGSRQKSLAFAAIALFVVLSGGLVWMISGPRGTTAAAMGPNAPLELVSLTHERQNNNKLAVSGLVRNPASGKPVQHLSAVVFLFDRMGTFIASSRANVDFLKLGAGDETPFVVTLDAPPTVARYRVSFRTDEGIVPHIDRRADAQTAAPGEQPLNVSVK